MTTLVAKHRLTDEQQDADPRFLSGGLAVSLLLHALVAVFMIGGVGLALPEPPEVEAVEVEIVPPPEPQVPEQETREEPAPPPPAPPQVKPEPEPQPEEEVAEAPPPPDILPAVQEFGDTDTQAEVTSEEEAAEGPETQAGPEQEEPEAGVPDTDETSAEDSGAEEGTDTETSEGPSEEAEETTETPTPELPEVPEAEATVPEPEPEPEPDPQPEPEPEQEEEPAPEPEAEAEQPAEPETVPEPEAETEVAAAAPEGTPEEDEGTEVAPETQPVTEPEPETEVAALPEPEIEPEPEDFGTVGRIVTAQLPKAKPAVPRSTARRSSAAAAPGRGAMTVARQLYSADLTSDSRTRAAIRGMTRGERLNLLCVTELRGQLNNGNPPYFPDLMPSFRRTRGGRVLDPGGWVAFRSFGLWYNVTFRCEADSTVRRVVNFRYRVGEPIPRSEWAERRLPAN